MRFFAFLVAALLVSLPASAVRIIIVGGTSAATYAGLGDVTSLDAYWGFRAYSAAVAAGGSQKLFNARRLSDSETCDFLVNTGGGIGSSTSCSGADNGQALATFLNATSGVVTEMYDQTGNGNHIFYNSVPTNQPPIVLNSLNGSACIQATTGNMSLLTSGTVTPATGVVSIVTEANRSGGTGSSIFVREDASNRIQAASGTANKWVLSGNASSFQATANDAAWHAGVGVINGASSVLAIDGTETTGTVTGATTAGSAGFAPSGATTTLWCEGGYKDNTAWNGTVRGNLHTNMSAYWGTP